MKSDETVEKRVILIGPYQSGKTTLLHRLMGDYSFVSIDQTICIDYRKSNLSHNNNQYPVRLYDTPGIERYRMLLEKYLIQYLIHGDLILLLFREDTMKEAIEVFYPLYTKHQIETGKLIFVENGVKEENHCILTERQKRLYLDNFKQFDEDYIQIDCNTIYNIDKLKELIASHWYDKNYIIRRRRKDIIGNFSIILKTQKNMKINNSCV